MPIPFLNLTRQFLEIEADATAAVARVLHGGNYVLGPEVAAFETEWSRYCAMPAAVTVANGTDALALALVASGAVRRGHGDEVITTPLTAGYTALAILNAGGVPVFADIEPDTCTLAPAALERAITPRTRAVVPVHLYGQMADMPALCAVAARHKLIVIEDAAQAHGAQLAGQSVGAYGHAATYSFYPTKNLGAYGDGGAVVSRDEELLARIKDLRQGGHAHALAEGVEGRNSRLDEIQAALLRVKLRRLAEWNEQRIKLARRYNDGLQGTPAIKPPTVRADATHVYHLYVVQHRERERLRAHLAAQGIETLIHYPFLLHQQRLFQRPEQPALPVAERIAPRLLSLPLYPQLLPAEADAVIHALQEYAARCEP